MTTRTEARWASRKGAAAMYGITVQRVDELRRSGVLRTKKDGRHILIEVASLEEWIVRDPSAVGLSPAPARDGVA